MSTRLTPRRALAALAATFCAVVMLIGGAAAPASARVDYTPGCPTRTGGSLCIWNKSFFYGNRYVAGAGTHSKFRLGPYWKDKVFSYKVPYGTDPVWGSTNWVGYFQNNCRGSYVTFRAGTQNSSTRDESWGGRIESISTAAALQTGC